DRAIALKLRWLCSAQTMNRPLFKIFLGSMAFLSARIMAMSCGVVPHKSKWSLASLGQCATSADDPAGSMPRNAEAQFAYCIADGGSTESGMNATTRFPVAARPRAAGIKL